MLGGSFGTGLWNVALEPERRKLLRKFRESPGKRPRLIPVIGLNAGKQALLSEK